MRNKQGYRCEREQSCPLSHLLQAEAALASRAGPHALNRPLSSLQRHLAVVKDSGLDLKDVGHET